jgi:hypothetical protein
MPGIGRYAILAMIFGVIVLKVILVAPRDIGGHLEAWDQLWHIISGNTWYWGRKYDQMALARPAIYPLFIAVNNALGVPLRLMIEALYIAGAGSLAFALGRLHVPIVLRFVGFAFVVLHPYSLAVFDNALAETFYSCLILLLFGEFTRMLTPRSNSEQRFRFASFALLIALLWFTRPEWPILAVFLTMLGALFFLACLLGVITRRQTIRLIGAGIGLPLLAVLTLGLAVGMANYCRHGVFMLTELNAPNFIRAYDALQAIDSGEPARFVPVAKISIERAYAYSPALEELRPHIEGDLWHRVAKGSKAEMGPLFPDGEIGAGWFYWMLREFVAMAGHHADARQADAFYGRLANEIESALADGRLPRRAKILPFVDPNFKLWLPHLPQSLFKVGQLLFPSQPGITPQQTLNLPVEFEKLFDSVANRRVETASNFKHNREVTYAKLDRMIERTRQVYHPALVLLTVSALMVFLIGGTLPNGPAGGRFVLAPWYHLVVLATCIGMIAGRVLLFAVIDASAWPGAQIRYLFPVMPLVPIVVILLTCLRRPSAA